jgi:MscS family membrane protein
MPRLHIAWDGWVSVVLPLALAAALAISYFVVATVGWLFGRITRRTPTPVDDKLIARLRAPAAAALGFALWRGAIGVVDIDIPPRALAAVDEGTRLAYLAFLFWGILRLVEVGGEWLRHSHWATRNSLSRSMVPLSTRVAKAIIIVIGTITVISELGYPVASLLAGLGIGGIAIALAAQTTVGNLLGTFAIGVDQPLREGDAVKAGDVTGTVESVGLRSTRIRTADRTVVTVPHGALANMNIESFALRDRFRLSLTLRLRYTTTSTQVREILRRIDTLLAEHPKRGPDQPSVHLTDIGDSWLTVDVVASFATADGGEFNDIREDVLLGCIEIVEKAGSGLAFPPMTTIVQPAPGVPATPTSGSTTGRVPALT